MSFSEKFPRLYLHKIYMLLYRKLFFIEIDRSYVSLCIFYWQMGIENVYSVHGEKVSYDSELIFEL
jgi:hypothetical protein